MKHTSISENKLLQEIKIQETTLQYLQSEYKVEFSDEEWEHICLFEHHFQTENTTDVSDAFGLDELITKKNSFWDYIRKLKDIISNFANTSRKTISRRKNRHISWESQNGVHVWTDKVHNPLIIEQHVYEYITSIYGDDIQRVVCVDCSEICQHTKGIHVHFDLASPDCRFMEEIASSARRLLANKHSCSSPSVLFWKPDSTTQYVDKSGNIARFHLRDDVTHGKIGENIVWNSTAPADDVDILEGECVSCFSEVLPKPLHWECFNISEEWNLDVPLTMQIILESFINRNSIRKSNASNELLDTKYKALYSTYDRLLNVFNKNHIGIIQERNTTELSMHYTSVSTVFGITSH